MELKQIGVTAGVALVVALGAIWLVGAGKMGPPGPQGPQGSEGKFGALAGPDIPSPYLQWGGVYEYRTGAAIAATSSMLCDLTSPPATSTPRILGITFDSNDIGAFSMDISTTTSLGYGSSTPAFIASAPVAAAVIRPVVWTFGTATTTSKGVWGSYNLSILSDAGTQTGESSFSLPPNTHITFRVATATPRTLTAYSTGHCSGAFLVI